MKVAIILRPDDQAPPSKYGGCGRVVALLAEGLIQRDHEVTLYTAKPPTLGCEVIQPAGTISQKYRWDIGEARWAGYSAKVFEHIKNLESGGEGYDIINNHYDPVTFILGRQLETPRLTTLHGIANDENLACFGTYPDENFSALTHTQRKQYPEDMNFLGVVYNAISKDHPFSENKREYLFSVSRIRPSKGQRNAIGIARKASLDLVMAGNAVDEYYFHTEILPNIDRDLSRPGRQKERGDFIWDIENYQPGRKTITYIGEVTEQERDQVMKHARAFLFPLEGDESCPLVLLEAGIVGTPIIASNKSVVPEMVEQGKNGFYGNSIDELVEFTRKIGEIEPKDCREHVIQNFSVDEMVDGYTKLYEEVIGIEKGKRHRSL